MSAATSPVTTVDEKSDVKNGKNGKNGKNEHSVFPSVIPFRTLFADPVFNVRSRYDASYIQELAESIDKLGQKTPITVRCDVKPDGTVYYPIISGFCRYTAMASLGWDKKNRDVKVVVETVETLEDVITSYISNIAENTARKNVDSYDLAKRFHDLDIGIPMPLPKNAVEGQVPELIKVERKTISERTALSVSYVNNLIRAYKNCAPAVRKAWQIGYLAGGKRWELTTNQVNTFARTGDDRQPMSDEVQGKMLEDIIQAKEEELEKQDGTKPKKAKKKDKDDEGGTGPSGDHYATKKDIEEAYEKLISKGEEGYKGVQLAYLEGMIQGIRYARGNIGLKGLTVREP